MDWQKLVSQAFIITVLAMSIRLAIPLLVAAVGEVFAERAGILNVGIEGMMLMGALGGFLGSYLTNSAWLGLLIGMLAAGLISLIHAYLSITLGTDQVISGIAINLLCIGLSTFLNRAVFGIQTIPPKAPSFSTMVPRGLEGIPVIGPILFSHNILTYLGVFLTLVAYVVLFKTVLGLKITATGEDPRAAEAVGVNVFLLRYVAVVIGGLMAGLAGVTLSLGQLNFFKEGMIAGRGFIALAVVMIGRWNPLGLIAAALLFGLADAFQLNLQALGFRGIPSEALLALPYVLTIIAVLSRLGRSGAPKALCIPYTRET